uniref:hypothetical protein n=1 Tax=Flavobacterium sp. TaxID=239 RepID=UPI004048440B
MIGNLPKPLKIAEAGVGGAEIFKLVTTESINLNYIETKPVTIYSITAIGTTDNLIYLKLYNKVSNLNPSLDSPLLLIPIPGNTKGAGVTISFPAGADFSEGLCCLVVNGIDDVDETIVGAGSAVINITYK